MYNILSAFILNYDLLKQIFILIYNRKDLSDAILRVLIITELTAFNTSCIIFILSLLLEEEDSDQSLDIRIIVTDGTLNIP